MRSLLNCIVRTMANSVPRSLLATALLLQTYNKVIDDEANQRADFDIR